MKATCDILFIYQKGYYELVELIRSNPHYVFQVIGEAKLDRRRAKAKMMGWVKLKHKSPSKEGYVRLEKKKGRCLMEIVDKSNGQLTGSWISWLLRNASDMLVGVDMREIRDFRVGIVIGLLDVRFEAHGVVVRPEIDDEVMLVGSHKRVPHVDLAPRGQAGEALGARRDVKGHSILSSCADCAQ